MSASNGDKSRYNRMRKQNIARRERNELMTASRAVQPPTASKVKPARAVEVVGKPA